MPIESQLLKEGRVILYTFTEPFSMQDVFREIEKHFPLYDNGSKPIHAIHDLLTVKHLPRNALSSISAPKATRVGHRNWGLMLVISQSSFISMMANAFSRIIPNSHAIMSTSMDDAMNIVEAALKQEADDANRDIA